MGALDRLATSRIADRLLHQVLSHQLVIRIELLLSAAFFGPHLGPPLLFDALLLVSLLDSIILVRDLEEYYHEQTRVHEDDNEVEFEEGHRHGRLLDEPSRAVLNLATERELLFDPQQEGLVRPGIMIGPKVAYGKDE